MTLESVVQALQIITEGLPKLVELVVALGNKRDAFFVAIDGALVVARAQHDAELERKHRKPSIRVPVDGDDEG